MLSLGFGLERLGLLAIRAPLVSLIVLIAVTAAGTYGVPLLKADDALSELFRSNSVEFRDYEKLSNRFPTSEYDILVVVEGANLLSPEKLEKVRLLHLELEFADAVAGVLSVFSVRDPPDASGFPPPMIPEDMPKGKAFDNLMKRVRVHPLIKGKFLATDQKGADLTVLVVSVDRKMVASKGLGPSVREIEKIGRDTLAGSGLVATFSGAPVMQLEIRDAIRHDRIAYNFAGLVVGMVICTIFFRRLSLVLIATVCPVLAVIWALGFLGLMGQKLNTFINVIPPLVMVIAFSDAMHMVFSIRRGVSEGMTTHDAARHAIRTVGPACVLTSLTTSIAMLSLTVADSGLIRSFGYAGSLATLLAFFSVITVVPVASILLIRNEEKFRRGEDLRARGILWLQRGCEAFADWLGGRYGIVATLGIIAISLFAAMHLQLEPQYRLSDDVPRQNESIETSKQLDEKLTGAHPLHIMLRWPDGKSLSSADVVAAIADAHRLLEAHPSVGNVWSIETLRRWLRDIGKTDNATLIKYVAKLPEHLTARFLNEREHAALVTGRVPNLDADQAVPIMRDLDNQLQVLRQRYPGFEFTVTGLSAVSALRSAAMIAELNRGLLTAIVVVIALIALAFRSLRIAFYSVIPNLFPIVTAGSVLFLTGSGLAYSSVIALTVAFGLAVDDTIHFLARMERERARLGRFGDAAIATLRQIGPVLVLTTIVLVAGLSVTMASDLPSMRVFGKLTMITLAAALIADMVILPAIVLLFARAKPKMKRSEA